MSVYFFIIVISAFLDIIANLLLKKSDGFRHKKAGILAIIFAIGAFYLLSLSLDSLPLSVAYSTWGAVGIIGTCAGGWILYKERLNFVGIIGVVIVIIAVILLNSEDSTKNLIESNAIESTQSLAESSVDYEKIVESNAIESTSNTIESTQNTDLSQEESMEDKKSIIKIEGEYGTIFRESMLDSEVQEMLGNLKEWLGTSLLKMDANAEMFEYDDKLGYHFIDLCKHKPKDSNILCNEVHSEQNGAKKYFIKADSINEVFKKFNGAQAPLESCYEYGDDSLKADEVGVWYVWEGERLWVFGRGYDSSNLEVYEKMGEFIAVIAEQHMFW